MTVAFGSQNTSSTWPTFDWHGNSLIVNNGPHTLHISLRCPEFVLRDERLGGQAADVPTVENTTEGWRVGIKYPVVPLADGRGIEAELFLQWFDEESVLRKWARVRLVDAAEPAPLVEVVLDELPISERITRFMPAPPQSHPVFCEGFFAGIEFPVASTCVRNGRAVLAHRPGVVLEPGVWYETSRAVFGVTARGEERRAFQSYILAHRPVRAGMHINYNSWWTSPVPYTEKDILDIMEAFRKELYEPYGVSFDTFCIDLGWSERESVWEIDRQLFPEGFKRIRQAAGDMGCDLGLWISPSSCYDQALDNKWLDANGYESFAMPERWPFRFACLAGERYSRRFADRLAAMIREEGVRHVKLDGYLFECPENDHGHEPGPLSSEAIARGFAAAAAVAREASQDVWLETTCFGLNPSPWWLFHFDSVIGSFGDDAPSGRVPCPIYRESYTTARDFFCLQGAHWSPVPLSAQEVLGIVHQSPEPFGNDAVMTVMRGHMFLPVYVNPKYMEKRDWRALAETLQWARDNARLLQDTRPLLPVSWRDGKCPQFSHDALMPREPYGYAHGTGTESLVVLRNPWIEPQTYRLKLDESIGLSDGTGELTAVSLYPEARLYGKRCRSGGTLDVALAPYETLVLSLAPDRDTENLEAASNIVRTHIEAKLNTKSLTRMRFTEPTVKIGPGRTGLFGDAPGGVRLLLEAVITCHAPEADVLVLLEADGPVAEPLCKAVVNAVEVSADVMSSESGWSADSRPKSRHWLFVRVPLVEGDNEVRIDLLVPEEGSRPSVWVWARRSEPIGPLDYADILPAPKEISLDAVCLVEPADTAAITGEPIPMERPVE